MTREKTLAGHVWDCDGISRAVARVGRITLKPLTKYSWSGTFSLWVSDIRTKMFLTAMTIDASNEKQKPISVHTVLNLAGLSLPSRSMRACMLSPSAPPSSGAIQSACAQALKHSSWLARCTFNSQITRHSSLSNIGFISRSCTMFHLYWLFGAAVIRYRNPADG